MANTPNDKTCLSKPPKKESFALFGDMEHYQLRKKQIDLQGQVFVNGIHLESTLENMDKAIQAMQISSRREYKDEADLLCMILERKTKINELIDQLRQLQEDQRKDKKLLYELL